MERLQDSRRCDCWLMSGAHRTAWRQLLTRVRTRNPYSSREMVDSKTEHDLKSQRSPEPQAMESLTVTSIRQKG